MPSWPRISPLACGAGFAAGIAGADAVDRLAGSPAPFAALSAVLALLALRRPNAALLLFFVAALGAARGACDTATHRGAARALDPDLLAEPRWHRGIVSGPVATHRGGYRFALDTGDGDRFLVLASGAGAAPPLPGDRVAIFGRLSRGPRYLTPGVPDPDRRLRGEGATALLVAGGDRVGVVGPGDGHRVMRLAARAQRRLAANVAARGGPRRGSAVVMALASGDRSAIDEETSAALRRAGIGHILAVSGLHLAVVGLAVFAAVRRLWAAIGPLAARLEPSAAAAAAALGSATSYALVTGARPSALRALLVLAVILIGRARWLRAPVASALGLAALALLAHRPALIWDPSFQMSFGAAAVLTLAFAGRRPGGRWRRLVGAPVAVSAWALAATAPTAALLFSELAPAGLVANVVALPLVELAVLPLALIGSGVGLVAPRLGGPLLDAAIALAELVVGFAELVAAAIPAVSVPPLSPLELAGLGAALGCALLATHRRGRARVTAALAAAALLVATATSLGSRRGGGGLRVAFLDVGQGDAAVIELPEGGVWLVDGGGRPFAEADDAAVRRRRGEAPGRESLLRYLRHRRIDRIDVLVISHPHPDHFLGLGALAGEIDIDRIWIAAPHPEQPLPPRLRALLAALRVLGAELASPELGAPIRAGGAELVALAPRHRGRLAADPVSSVNDNSVLLRLEYAGRRILFTGDLEAEGEELAVRRLGPALAADVVKVPHHGSATSSTPALIEATRPHLAVISCGRGNRFDFPDPGVLERWRAAGAEIARTDLEGAVTITVDRRGALAVERYVD